MMYIKTQMLLHIKKIFVALCMYRRKQERGRRNRIRIPGCLYKIEINRIKSNEVMVGLRYVGEQRFLVRKRERDRE